MNARRDSADEPEAGSFGGRALLAGAVLFAAVATGLLVLTDSQKWLRLGIVAALWAALVGAFLAARYRRQLTDQREAAAERQEIYELELEREIAARREHELEVEAEARRKAEESARDDIAALRGELEKMRQTLESLLNGEFLVERYALHAESTRMRSFGDDRAIAMRNDVKRLPAAQAEVIGPPVVREAETEMIERVREVHQKPRRQEPRVADTRQPRTQARAEWPTPEPGRPVKPKPAARQEPAQPAAAARLPERPVREPVARVPEVPVREPVARASEVPVREPVGRAPELPVREPRVRTPEPQTRVQEQPPRVPESPVRRPEPPPRLPEHPPRVPEHPAEVSDRWFVPEGLAGTAAAAAAARRAEARRPEQSHRPEPQRPADPPPRRPAPEPAAHSFDASVPFGGKAEQTSWLAQYNQSSQEPTYSSRAYVPPIRPEPQPEPAEPVLNDRPSRRGAEYRAEEPAAGRRHRAEAEEESGGGRRRRAEGQPSWQETVGQTRPEEPSGSHAAGRSVSELLATHGLESSPRRRRRRED